MATSPKLVSSHVYEQATKESKKERDAHLSEFYGVEVAVGHLG